MSMLPINENTSRPLDQRCDDAVKVKEEKTDDHNFYTCISNDDQTMKSVSDCNHSDAYGLLIKEESSDKTIVKEESVKPTTHFPANIWDDYLGTNKQSTPRNPLFIQPTIGIRCNTTSIDRIPFYQHHDQLPHGYVPHCPFVCNPSFHVPCRTASPFFNNVTMNRHAFTFQEKLEQWRKLTQELLIEMQRNNYGVNNSFQETEIFQLQTEILKRSIFCSQNKSQFLKSMENESSTREVLGKLISTSTDQLRTLYKKSTQNADLENDKKVEDVHSLKTSRRMRKRIRDAKMRLLKHHWMQRYSKDSSNRTLDPITFPIRPLTAYMRFSTSVYESIRAKYPDAKLSELGKLTGEMWRNLDNERKQLLIYEYEADKVRYEQQMQILKSDPICQTILSDNQTSIHSDLSTISNYNKCESNCDRRSNSSWKETDSEQKVLRTNKQKQTYNTRRSLLRTKIRKLKKRPYATDNNVQCFLDLPIPPAKPLTPYMRFSTRMYESIRSKYPNAALSEVGKVTGQMWRDLDDESKQPLIDEYQSEKEQYLLKMKEYKESLIHRQYYNSTNESKPGGHLLDKCNNIESSHVESSRYNSKNSLNICSSKDANFKMSANLDCSEDTSRAYARSSSSSSLITEQIDNASGTSLPHTNDHFYESLTSANQYSYNSTFSTQCSISSLETSDVKSIAANDILAKQDCEKS